MAINLSMDNLCSWENVGFWCWDNFINSVIFGIYYAEIKVTLLCDCSYFY